MSSVSGPPGRVGGAQAGMWLQETQVPDSDHWVKAGGKGHMGEGEGPAPPMSPTAKVSPQTRSPNRKSRGWVGYVAGVSLP